MAEGRPKRTFGMSDAVRQELGAVNGGHTVSAARAEGSWERHEDECALHDGLRY